MGGAVCKICDSFTAVQREMQATPQYQIRKDRKAGILVSPNKVTVLSPVNPTQEQDVSTPLAQPVISSKHQDVSTAHAQQLPGGSDNVREIK